eukprot:6041509-Pleurochrysis_carterae.AAC.1
MHATRAERIPSSTGCSSHTEIIQRSCINELPRQLLLLQQRAPLVGAVALKAPRPGGARAPARQPSTDSAAR